MFIKAKDAHHDATNNILRVVAERIVGAINRGEFQERITVPRLQAPLVYTALREAGYVTANIAYSKTHEEIRVSWEEV